MNKGTYGLWSEYEWGTVMNDDERRQYNKDHLVISERQDFQNVS